MVCQSFIFFLVALKDLVPVVMNAAEDLIRPAFGVKCSLDHGKFLIMPYILCVNRIEIALAKAEIVNGIEQVGLPYTIIPDETIDAGREGNFSFGQIFKIQQG
jgi:hypothetical protein